MISEDDSVLSLIVVILNKSILYGTTRGQLISHLFIQDRSWTSVVFDQRVSSSL